MTTRTPLTITAATTRAEIQAEITAVRADQRGACISSTADEYAAVVDGLLDGLLLREPEPV